MSAIMETITGDTLPEDLIIEILSWLPVTTLLQFKCVCRSWYTIITSHKFVSKHLENYYNKDDDIDCLLVEHYETPNELEVIELLVDGAGGVLSNGRLLEPLGSSEICGPCVGLFYVYNPMLDPGRALWNPTMGELKFLPPLMRYSHIEACGFGRDPVTKDYKVILIKGYWDEALEKITRSTYARLSSVLVYSLSTDSWADCGDLAQYYDIDKNRCYTCVNGMLHWLGSCENGEVMISFDLASDEFQEIEAPRYEKPASRTLALYNESIALFTVHKVNQFLDIWTLNEEMSWNKKIRIGPLSGVEEVGAHWRNNEIILKTVTYGLISFDLSTQETRRVIDQVMCGGIFIYKESLVSFKGRKGCTEHDADETKSKYPYTIVSREGDLTKYFW